MRRKPRLSWSALYWQDLLTDHLVLEMSNEELGAYVRLLGAQWFASGRGLNPDPNRLAGAAHVSDAERWSGIWLVLEPHFPISSSGKDMSPVGGGETGPMRARGDGRRRNGRLHEEWTVAVFEYERAQGAARKRHGQDAMSVTGKDIPSGARAPAHAGARAGAHAGARAIQMKMQMEEEDIVPPQSGGDSSPGSLTTPAPPVSDPAPPGGCSSKPSTEASPAPSRISLSEVRDRWNELAAECGLAVLRAPLSEKRQRQVQRVVGKFRRRGLSWFSTLAAAVRTRRSEWAKEGKFPSFDQATREDVVDRLDEGFYERDRETVNSGPVHANRQSDFENTKGPTKVTIIRPEDRR